MAVQDPMKWFKRQTAPATIVLCALVIIGFFVDWSAPLFVKDFLSYPGLPIPKVWTLFTYTFFQIMSPIFLLFQVMWLFWVGSMLERDHGTRKFIYLWLVVSAIGVLPLSILQYPNSGMFIPDAILVSIWATRYPNMIIRLFMVIPVAAKWIGLIVVASVFFSYASGPSQIFVGFLAILGCIAGFLYARNQIPKLAYGLGHGNYVKPKPTKAQLKREKEYFDDVYRREKERDERERLRKLFEDSLDDKK